MKDLVFKARVRRVGSSAVITIPAFLILNGVVKEGQEYRFKVV